MLSIDKVNEIEAELKKLYVYREKANMLYKKTNDQKDLDNAYFLDTRIKKLIQILVVGQRENLDNFLNIYDDKLAYTLYEKFSRSTNEELSNMILEENLFIKKYGVNFEDFRNICEKKMVSTLNKLIENGEADKLPKNKKAYELGPITNGIYEFAKHVKNKRNKK